MNEIVKGAAALGGLDGGDESKSEFTKLSAGTSLKVRVKGTEDLIRYFGYGVFKSPINKQKVPTFIPKDPPTRNKKGFPEENLTPWDLATNYYDALKKQAQEAGNDKDFDKYRNLAGQFRFKERYVFGFVDLDTAQDIVIDFTKIQAQGVHATIKNYATKLDKLAFKLSKEGNGKDTKVTLMPLIDMDEDLTDKQRANFDKTTGVAFDDKKFDGLLLEADYAKQVENLVTAGFDVSLIGLEAPGEAGKPAETNDDNDLTSPF